MRHKIDRPCAHCGADVARGDGLYHFREGLLCGRCWDRYCQGGTRKRVRRVVKRAGQVNLFGRE